MTCTGQRKTVVFIFTYDSKSLQVTTKRLFSWCRWTKFNQYNFCRKLCKTNIQWDMFMWGFHNFYFGSLSFSLQIMSLYLFVFCVLFLLSFIYLFFVISLLVLLCIMPIRVLVTVNLAQSRWYAFWRLFKKMVNNYWVTMTRMIQRVYAFGNSFHTVTKSTKDCLKCAYQNIFKFRWYQFNCWFQFIHISLIF